MTNTTDIHQATEIIHDGGLVALPTETVYGLAADATNDGAVARIFEAKGRPQFNPLITHVLNLDATDQHVVLSPLAHILAESLWPGPLTMVLPRRPQSALSLLVSAGLETVAVRVPAHPVARALLGMVKTPLAAPSANLSGKISPTTANHVREGLGDQVDFILDGGASTVGVESTILYLDGSDATLLRAGGIPREHIEQIMGAPLKIHTKTEKPLAPGLLRSHYAPHAKLRINAIDPKHDEALLGFGDSPSNKHTMNLSMSGDLREAAANLFAYLRALDAYCLENNLTGIAAMPIPMHGLGEAINDRLRRAASPE